MSSTQRSLVLGVLTSLPASAAEPFARSLRATGFVGELHLFVGNMAEGDVEALRELADAVHVVDARFPRRLPVATLLLRYVKRQRGLRRFYPAAFRLAVGPGPSADRRWRALEFHLEGLQTLRYELYAQFLDELGADADYVLLSDVRDVWFQDDPFTKPPQGLEVFLEEPTVRIGAEPFNHRWIEHLYGGKTAAQLSNNVVSCSGTTSGPRDEVLRYARSMAVALKGRRRPMSSHDQGVHNYLLRTGALDPVEIVDNTSGRVLTMSVKMTPRLEGDLVLSNTGAAPPVVHQYDRHPEATALFERRLTEFRERTAP